MRWLIIPALLVLGGCANTVTAPAEPEDPVAVYLLDHGRHSSIVLTAADDSLVRYSYGDWSWYALNRKGPLRASGTLFISGQAALGRRELPGPSGRSNVRAQVHVPITQLWEFRVSSERVAALHARLEEMFEAARDSLVVNELYDLELVHHPNPYNILHNSNHVSASWLRELDIAITQRTVLSTWRVNKPERMTE